MFTLDRFEANPILSPDESSPWESLVRTNPAAYYSEDGPYAGKFVMLYRAAGHDDEHLIRLGLAISDDGYRFEVQSREPVFAPIVGTFDEGGCEDPRLTRMGEWYMLTYATRPRAPGKYWLPATERKHTNEPLAECWPQRWRNNDTATGLAYSKDLREWVRCGRLTDPRVDDRDVVLFPELIDGRWWMIHRPMQWCGAGYENAKPAVWIQSSDDCLAWDYGTSQLLFKAEREWETKVGGNGPPLRTKEGWVFIYHGVGSDGFYRLGAVLLDLQDPTKVIGRTADPIYEPVMEYETKGYYEGGGVVFPCANVVKDGTLFIYYGGADRHVCVATCELDALLGHLRSGS